MPKLKKNAVSALNRDMWAKLEIPIAHIRSPFDNSPDLAGYIILHKDLMRPTNDWAAAKINIFWSSSFSDVIILLRAAVNSTRDCTYPLESGVLHDAVRN